MRGQAWIESLASHAIAISLLLSFYLAPARLLAGDNICGPRAIQFLERFYGRPETTLAKIFRDTEFDLSKGMAIDKLSAELRARQIASSVIRIPASSIVQSKYPVILHTRPIENNGVIGHYLVIMPSEESGTILTWSGLEGYKWMDEEELASASSGYAVITAVEDSDLDSSQFRRIGPTTFFNALIAIGTFLLATCGGQYIAVRTSPFGRLQK
jgi:ABC-type bacteriocin/lantibiotic exporter with double-glycine peptidase domain